MIYTYGRLEIVWSFKIEVVSFILKKELIQTSIWYMMNTNKLHKSRINYIIEVSINLIFKYKRYNFYLETQSSKYHLISDILKIGNVSDLLCLTRCSCTIGVGSYSFLIVLVLDNIFILDEILSNTNASQHKNRITLQIYIKFFMLVLDHICVGRVFVLNGICIG